MKLQLLSLTFLTHSTVLLPALAAQQLILNQFSNLTIHTGKKHLALIRIKFYHHRMQFIEVQSQIAPGFYLRPYTTFIDCPLTEIDGNSFQSIKKTLTNLINSRFTSDWDKPRKPDELILTDNAETRIDNPTIRLESYLRDETGIPLSGNYLYLHCFDAQYWSIIEGKK